MVFKNSKYLDNIRSKFHMYLLGNHRERVLASHIQPLIPLKSNVLDVGCGGGYLSKKIKNINSDIIISGIDVFEIERGYIPVKIYDGKKRHNS